MALKSKISGKYYAGQIAAAGILLFFSFLLLCSVIILLIDQPDLGQSILLIGSWVFTVFISGVSIFYIISFFSIFIFSSTGSTPFISKPIIE